MTLFDRRDELKDLILTAISRVVAQLASKNTKKDFYSLVFFPSSGYRSISVAYNTRSHLKNKPTGRGPALDRDVLKMLKDHPDLLGQVSTDTDLGAYNEVNACEWEGVDVESFSEVNNIINSGYDALYDAGTENDEICRFFESILTEVLLEVKSSGILNDAAFSRDVLLGLQFPDSGNAATVKRISKKVNSAAWHKKVCAAYGS